jgi:predicted nucleic acid-binding protein
MVYGPEQLSPGSCLHLAVMERHEVTRIMSFDPEYDRYPPVTRLTAS